jgi:putative endonuclease
LEKKLYQEIYRRKPIKKRMFMFYVYVLKCKDKSFYTGYTNNIEERIKKHNEGKAAKYTRSRLPVKLVAKWPFDSRSKAMKSEAEFKKLSHREKIKRIRQIII